MAASWGDYAIVGVRYSACGSHIDVLRIRPYSGGSLGAVQEQSRTWVVQQIGKNKTFCTATYNATTAKWTLGANVDVVSVATDYLKTRADKSERDNLENLPPF